MANIEQATLGAGCFWCVESFFNEVKGVIKAISGYSGGSVPGTPTYKEVCSGLTGHAEVVRVEFDADIISYEDILYLFFTAHNPTTLNRQGADVGTQYRSVIFYHHEEQKIIAEKVTKEVQQYFEDPIVTEISPLINYFDAEDYHQNYYKQNPNEGYCAMVIGPKLNKLRKLHADKLKDF
ncbi:peptide-methionine (S)-S-oxide reductase MsrA [Wenyingzhuangia marina]|uniref:Peptide methionine sulfoxide reductase MsrA n=1 Tax=Wenyingzhuangia marina TaxID=1195760 RepID=A0A1M5VJ40_9FLAO|nr:peptide-methionine (S)-S-oxide reductase MsrA [Wenyingzhuangia marina]GGF71940.1 peptide methionine sulfoxide reductase MsrA [Wenyingzhuangia marina]SHH75084.1 peptide-methionine (S)-S-oxide reductase [Wenyingzhuangia marina]